LATGKDMCELIWQAVIDMMPEALLDMTPEMFWNYSSTGELSRVFFQYYSAKEYFFEVYGQ
jgi:hypothetical protein